jgi:hypothetical protein
VTGYSPTAAHSEIGAYVVAGDSDEEEFEDLPNMCLNFWSRLTKNAIQECVPGPGKCLNCYRGKQTYRWGDDLFEPDFAIQGRHGISLASPI